MRRHYNMVCCFEIEATCLTPFRVGNYENNIETVLKNASGEAFIAGTSIAGVIKNYWNEVSKSQAVNLFGNEDVLGKLIVSDGVFTQFEEKVRPRVRICEVTGATIQGAKFDIAHIQKGGKFNFSLTWFGDKDFKENDTELEEITKILSAINSGEITFGGQKSNGFGQVELRVYKKIFNLFDEKDRNDWLNSNLKGDEIKLAPYKAQNIVKFTVKGKCDNILVKGETVTKDKKTKECNLTEANIPVVPGSSVKGAIRSRAEAISELIYSNTELVDEYFGTDKSDTPIAGKVIFSDIYMKAPKKKEVTRIKINKFTGGVLSKSLFCEESISTDVEFVVKVPNKNEVCGLVLLALRDLAFGLVNFGSGYAIGRGFIDVSEIQIEVLEFEKVVISIDKNKQITINDNDQVLELMTGGLCV